METLIPIRLFAIITAISTVGLANAFEPFQVDLAQNAMAPSSPNIDHLEPAIWDRPIPEFHYLAQYWAESTTTNYHYLVVVRNEKTGRCFIQVGSRPKHELHGRPYPFKHQAEISAETASLIYEYWTNMLLETRYDRNSFPLVLGRTRYTFSAFVRGIGWLHGCTHTGISSDMPPYWMSQTGEALFAFATKSEHNETELRELVKTNRDRFYEYMKNHPRT
jgi:hypothetical protein